MSINQTKGTLVTEGVTIKRAVSICTTLAENGTDEYKNIEFRIMDKGFLISATDGARHVQFSIPSSTVGNNIFCVNGKRLDTIVPSTRDPLIFKMRSLDIVVEDHLKNQMQLKTAENLDLGIIQDIGYSEKMSVKSFISQLNSLIPLVQSDSKVNYILISKGLMVAQRTLMFGVTEVKSLSKTYVLDLFTAKLINRICKQVDDRDTASVLFHQDPDGNYTIIKVGNARIKFATISSEEINLDDISQMKKVSGFMVHRPRLQDALNKMQILTNATDVDIVSLTDDVRFSPALEEYKDTFFTLPAQELREKQTDKTSIKATVNIDTLRSALKSFRQDAVYIVPSYENVIILFDANTTAPVRYFLSVL